MHPYTAHRAFSKTSPDKSGAADALGVRVDGDLFRFDAEMAEDHRQHALADAAEAEHDQATAEGIG